MDDKEAKTDGYRIRDLLPKEDGTGGEIEFLTPGNVRITYTLELLSKLVTVQVKDPPPNTADLMAFGNCCLETGANPYLKEAWLVRMNGVYTPIISAQFKLRKAHECKGYQGFQQGWITKDGKRHPSGQESTALPANVIGAWGKFHRANEVEYYHETFLSEFVRSTWKKPLTMLLKVNRDHGIRHKFPELLDGMYTENEVPGDYTLPAPVCGTPGRGDAKPVDSTVTVIDPTEILSREDIWDKIQDGFTEYPDIKTAIDDGRLAGSENWIFEEWATFVLQCKREDIANPDDYTLPMLHKLYDALRQPLPDAIIELIPKGKDENDVDNQKD